MSDEQNDQNKPQDRIEKTDELSDEELEQVAGGEDIVAQVSEESKTRSEIAMTYTRNTRG